MTCKYCDKKISHIVGGCIRLQSVLVIYLQKQFAYRFFSNYTLPLPFKFKHFGKLPRVPFSVSKDAILSSCNTLVIITETEGKRRDTIILTEILKRDIHLLPKERVKLITNKTWVKIDLSVSSGPNYHAVSFVTCALRP